MFRWLRRNKRDIFRYFDGVRNRSIDPLLAWQMMHTHPCCNYATDFPASDDGDFEAIARVQAMAREIFDIKAYSENTPGLTQNELNSLIASFLTFMARLKKKRDISRMRWERSVLESSPDASTTPPESESCSMPSESKSDEPPPS